MEFWKDNALEMRETVDTFVGPIVEKALDERGQRLSKGEHKVESKSLLDDLVDLTQGAIHRHPFRKYRYSLFSIPDPKFLRDEVQSFHSTPISY